jgi:hypothetical protein
MMPHTLNITPRTKVGELLDAYPQLEKVLLDISPVFAKLKNPVLRKTVARVATLQQAAIVGGMPVEELVNRLRAEAGQDDVSGSDNVPGYVSQPVPEWFSEADVVDRFDATRMINSGESPMNEVLSRAKNLGQSKILELRTPFIPAPILEMLMGKGYQVWSQQDKRGVSSFIRKN